MDSPIENSYGFFRVDERCKKLERTVKMLQMQQLEKKSNENSASDVVETNISSINGDAFDSSCAYLSKPGSEIISSSTNMKNLFTQKMNYIKNYKNIATSSVKNSPDNDLARASMPPPKGIPAFSNSSRKNTPTVCEAPILNRRHDSTGLGSDCFHPTSSSRSLQGNLSTQYGPKTERTQKSVADSTKPDRIFERWKIMINDKGQLLIKGVLEGCSKTVRSKPVIRRIDTSIVQSCFNHIYKLQGRLYDDKNELPEYIRSKFYIGFPDDWENDYQLWRSYISGGCKPSFRWPTPVTDSDDDLKSDITELIYPREEKKSCSRTKSRHGSVSNVKTLKQPPKKTSSDLSKTTMDDSESLAKNIQNSNNELSKKTASLSEEMNNTTAEVNLLLETMKDKHFCNSSASNNTIDEITSNAVVTLVNDRNCSVEYLEKIIEKLNFYKQVITSKPKISSADATNIDLSIAATDKVPPMQNTSKNSNITYTKEENIRNQTPKDVPVHTIQNHSYNFESVAKPSPSGSNIPSIRKVRRKLCNKDYESSEQSESDTEFQRQKSPRKVSKIYENQKITRATPIKKQPLRRVDNDSDDDLVPETVVHLNVGNAHVNEKVNNVHAHINEVDAEGFMKPMLKIQPRNTSINPINTHIPPSRYHRQRRAGSPSTITGFLTNYDSCVSISEDDRRVHTPRPKLDTKRTVNDINGKTLSSFRLKSNQNKSYSYYDSSVSITEDETEYAGNRTNIKKQVLQEPNIQCFQEMLKRNLKHKTSDKVLVDRRNLQDRQENTSNRTEKENRSNQNLPENYQTMPHELHQLQEKIKPSVINIEEVSYNVDNFLLNTSCREESTRIDSSRKGLNASDSKKHDSLPVLSTSNNIPNEANSKSLELQCKVVCKDISAQLKEVKNASKLELIAEKNANDKKRNEKFIYGSQENPQKLKNWCPNVLRKTNTTYGLIFEGKLLNEAGHVVNKKFKTDFVDRRVSLNVIKTTKNDFYELIGDITDTKHVVPKELLEYCTNKCPGQIINFCEKWVSITLNNAEVDRTINNIDMKNAPQSSRGRRILPPLSYWSGERLSVKGDNTVYTPPTSFNTSSETLKRDRSQSIKESLNESVERDKEKNSSKENEQITENKKELRESTKRKQEKRETELRRSYRKRKELTKLYEEVSENDSTSEEDYPLSKRRRSRYDSLRRKKNSQQSLNENGNETKFACGKSIGQKQNNISLKNSDKISVKYYKVISHKNDLSEYESSILG